MQMTSNMADKHHLNSASVRVDQTASLFRAEAMLATQQRWFGPVLVSTPPSLLLTVAIALLSLACLVTAAVVIEVPERVQATGVLLPSDGLLKVRASRSGWVDKLAVSNDSKVRRGQAMMWLTDAEHAPTSEPESQQRAASLRKELRLLGESLQQEVTAAAERQLLGQHRVRLMRDRIVVARQERDTRARQLDLQLRRSNRIHALVADAVIAAQVGDEQAAVVLDARAAGDAAELRVLQNQDQLALLEQQLQQDVAGLGRVRAQVGIRREALLREIATTDLQTNMELTAPDDGVVAGLAVRSGSFVRAGQVLLTLYDPGDALEAFLYVSAGNAGMVEAGQAVELQLLAYPHQLFGTQSAIITKVSAVAIAENDFENRPPVAGPVFEIRASLAAKNIRARGGAWRLPPGTVFEATLVRRRWPLYRWLFRSTSERDPVLVS